PNDATLRGTVRTFSDENLDLIENRMRDITEHTSRALDCQARFTFLRRYPPTVNHDLEAAFCANVLKDIVGEAQVDQAITPSMGAEDFAFMLKQVPGCYVWIGNGQGDHRSHGHGAGPCMLHNGSYDFNDDLIPLGATYWVALARHWLASPTR